jgi:DNA-binding MarR family transcriptional regulator
VSVGQNLIACYFSFKILRSERDPTGDRVELMRANDRDVVDQIVEQWQRVRPNLDVSPIEVIGRISRLSRVIDRELAANFAQFGIEAWMYDMLATLRRSGAPFELSAGELVLQSMVTTGAITNRIDRLAERGLVERATADDRRKVLVRLTPAGVNLVDRIAPRHYEFEHALLAGLTDNQARALSVTLRKLLLALGDRG